ncbi:hypothetical protein RCL_jg8608.t1 [Rhizophagus clarus]|uniref:Uncharacterized protein n=1 Tax=Rhizophagus clarus TaxID=94130 RepID=A0A8H3R228_9GLOM|nr:hypothetical protein RCL_jg8608.t1 [Rhizophagus clarus]
MNKKVYIDYKGSMGSDGSLIDKRKVPGDKIIVLRSADQSGCLTPDGLDEPRIIGIGYLFELSAPGLKKKKSFIKITDDQNYEIAQNK